MVVGLLREPRLEGGRKKEKSKRVTEKQEVTEEISERERERDYVLFSHFCESAAL